MNMNTLQIQAHAFDNNDLLRAAGVKRIHPGWYTVHYPGWYTVHYPGWYTVHYRGVSLDQSTICSATRNRKGEIRHES